MADVITNKDLKDPKKPAQPGEAPVESSNAQVQGNQQIANNYSKPKPAGSGFTNVQRILDANKGNQLGQNLSRNVQQAGQNAAGNAQQAGKQFQQETVANQADTGANQAVVSNVLNAPAQYVGTNQSDPNAQAGAKFSRLISGQYQGPTELQNQGQLQTQVNDATQLGQLAGSNYGRQGLLQRFVGTPQYQQGQQQFDATLLGGNQDLAAARREALQTQHQFGKQVAGTQAQAQEQAGRSNIFGQQVQKQLGENLTGFESGLQNKAVDAQAAQEAKFKEIHDQLASGQITPDEAEQLGIENNQFTYGVDPNLFIKQNNIKASAQNVASNEDYAKLNALKQLSGNYAPEAANDVFGKFSGQEANAGKFAQTPAYVAEKEGYQNAYNAAKNQYEADIKPTSDKLAYAREMDDVWKSRLIPGNYQNAMAKMYEIAPGAMGAFNQGSTKAAFGSTSGNTEVADRQVTEFLNATLQTAYKNHLNNAHDLTSRYGNENRFTVLQPQPAPQTPPDMGLEKMPKVR